MNRLVRLVVHVEEGLRIAEVHEDANQRIALLLLDSAAELLLHRECEWLLWREHSDWSHLQSLRMQEKRLGSLSTELKAEEQRLAARVTSKSRREKIDRTFDPKVEFVRDANLLPDAHVRVLSKLHSYRNEAYHRDKIRPATLATAVDIYAYLVCTMMRDFPVHAIGHTWGEPMPEALAKFIGQDFGALPEAQGRIATKLLETLDSSDRMRSLPSSPTIS